MLTGDEKSWGKPKDFILHCNNYPPKKGKPAAPTALKNIENSRKQEEICHMTLTASQTLDLNALQEKRLLYLQLSY